MSYWGPFGASLLLRGLRSRLTLGLRVLTVDLRALLWTSGALLLLGALRRLTLTGGPPGPYSYCGASGALLWASGSLLWTSGPYCGPPDPYCEPPEPYWGHFRRTGAHFEPSRVQFFEPRAQVELMKVHFGPS
jgi:hypothetical protein